MNRTNLASNFDATEDDIMQEHQQSEIVDSDVNESNHLHMNDASSEGDDHDDSRAEHDGQD
eukprot:CAMPEP_0116873488 /NCGR_PEP_ID=MMETSP0463-20121206/4640_1 /TAXON_ID=181622 /ORGANISM="Strombidinopsis sp, Strain SopsisLIS2011" /LENGTH=60 /DNA_ID=CAMNT_0004515563 /DNA_START=2079 /DNA_END=2261 /DNA_ORIENTATION=-